jgi:hypothetical protein
MVRAHEKYLLGEWLKKKVEETGLPVYKVTNRGNISRATLYAWMEDKYRPDPESLTPVVIALADILGQSSTKLLEEAFSMYVQRPEGRPKGAGGGGGGVRPVTVRGDTKKGVRASR